MISRSLVLDDPVVWWPAGSGAQVLHDLVLTHKAQEEHRKCGLRDARLIAEIAAAGLGFKFAINGRDIFARGANWVAADVLAGRITPEKIHRMLHSAVDANMNMIRVWDGGRYEPRWFYDLCDELCDDLGLTPATSAPTPQFTLRDLHLTTFSPV